MNQALVSPVKNLWETMQGVIASERYRFRLELGKLQSELEMAKSSEKKANEKYQEAMKHSENCLLAAHKYKDELVQANVNLNKLTAKYELVTKYAIAITHQLDARKEIEKATPAENSASMSMSVEYLQKRNIELEARLRKV